MIIEYENNQDDYIRGYEKFRTEMRKVQLRTTTIIIALILLFQIYHAYEMSTFYRIGVMYYAQMFLVGIVGYVFLMFVFIKKTKGDISQLITKNIKLKPSCIGKKSIEIKDDKIIYRSNDEYTHYNIKGIENIFEKNEQVILCVQNLNPLFIIPSKYFKNNDEKEAFIKTIKSKMDIKSRK